MAIDDPSVMTLLDVYPVLRHLSERRLADVRAEGASALAPRGAIVFDPADFCRDFPFLIEGFARVFVERGEPMARLLQIALRHMTYQGYFTISKQLFLHLKPFSHTKKKC